MSEKMEQTFLSPSDRFRSEYRSRIDLWKSMVVESTLAEDVKQQFLDILEKRKEFRISDRQYETIDDFGYYTNSILATLLYKLGKRTDIDHTEAEAVFENIRDDVWAFVKEIEGIEK